MEAVHTAGFQRGRQLVSGSLRVSFALCRSLNLDYRFPLRNTAFFKPGSAPSVRFQEQSHLLLFDLEAVPDQTARPPVPQQISQTHIVTSTQYPGHEVDFNYPARFAPSLSCPSPFVPVLGLQFCPHTKALLLRVVFKGGFTEEPLTASWDCALRKGPLFSLWACPTEKP